MEGFGESGRIFKVLTFFRIGSGEGVSFWNDCWCSGVPLSTIFPSLSRVSSTKFATVVDICVGQCGSPAHGS